MSILQVHELTCKTEQGLDIFSGAKLEVGEGDVVILQGKSGSGKTTLLKCIAGLNVYSGIILLHGKTPKSYGIPSYRVKVSYIAQRPPILPGTPRDFLNTVTTGFKARKKTPTRKYSEIEEIAQSFGIEPELWDREWSNLSGGETQRIALAIGVGLDSAEVLLLDEPTSALDPESSLQVERFLLDELRSEESTLKAIVWITHSEEQARRVGTRFIQISDSKFHEEASAV
ncbi:atp-binding cassette transporter [Moniliophthora roreri MCA 2997]|uniref:Atp-binding cassette transporter n=2 Tax=Moniliophthora roreri TaxID=221103 RepID=V2XVS9_MONRO|nr:atp-binding cassette transporter [Moniliophthora roreri MCA 2997]